MNNYSVFIEWGKFGKQDFRSVRQYFCKELLFAPFCQQESPATTLSVALLVRMRRSNGRSILGSAWLDWSKKLHYIFTCCFSTILDYLRAIFVEGLAIMSSNTSFFSASASTEIDSRLHTRLLEKYPFQIFVFHFFSRHETRIVKPLICVWAVSRHFVQSIVDKKMIFFLVILRQLLVHFCVCKERNH